MTELSTNTDQFSPFGSSVSASSGTGFVEARKWIRPVLLLTLAVSSIVLIEPAPYDVLVVALLTLLFFFGLRVPQSLSTGVFLLCVFLVGNLIGALVGGYSADGFRSLSIRIYLVLSWLLFASVVAGDPRTMIRTIWTGYAIAAFVALGWGVLQFYGYVPGEYSGAQVRATGPFKDPNVFAPFLVPVALLIVPRLFESRGLILVRDVGLFLLLTLGLFLAFSRGAWLNFLASLSVVTLFLIVKTSSKRQALKFLLIFIVMGLLGAFALVWVVQNTVAGQLYEQRMSLVQDYDITGRFTAQLAAVREIGVAPLGVGPGMAPLVAGRAPHNIYLHVALEAGWLGALSMYFFLLIGLWRGFNQLGRVTGELRTHTLIILASLLGILLQSLFIDSTHWRHFWILLAMLWGITTVTQDGRNTRPSTST